MKYDEARQASLKILTKGWTRVVPLGILLRNLKESIERRLTLVLEGPGRSWWQRTPGPPVTRLSCPRRRSMTGSGCLVPCQPKASGQGGSDRLLDIRRRSFGVFLAFCANLLNTYRFPFAWTPSLKLADYLYVSLRDLILGRCLCCLFLAPLNGKHALQVPMTFYPFQVPLFLYRSFIKVPLGLFQVPQPGSLRFGALDLLCFLRDVAFFLSLFCAGYLFPF